VRAPSFSSTNVPSSVLDDARHVSIYSSFFSFSLFAIFIVTLLHALQANSSPIQSLQAPLHLFLTAFSFACFLLYFHLNSPVFRYWLLDLSTQLSWLQSQTAAQSCTTRTPSRTPTSSIASIQRRLSMTSTWTTCQMFPLLRRQCLPTQNVSCSESSLALRMQHQLNAKRSQQYPSSFSAPSVPERKLLLHHSIR